MPNRARTFDICSALAPLLLLAAAALSAQEAPEGGRTRDWDEILGVRQGKLPSPRPNVQWDSDFALAKAQAAKEGRPLFVVLRCVSAPQCGLFDREVLAGSPLLDPLLRQFVNVRLTTIQDLDLRQFPVH